MKDKVNNFKTYLFWFANDHVDFRLSEIESIIDILKTCIKWVEKPSKKPYSIVDLPSDTIAREIAHRSVTLKHISELWVSSAEKEDLHSKLKEYSDKVLKNLINLRKASFKFNIEVFCNTQNYSEKIKKIESFNYLPFEGPVKLDNPDITLQYFEYYGVDPNNIPKKPYYLFFGKLIANSQRKIIHNLSLKKRTFIGNTSMDAELSLVMANHAKVCKGDVIYDPFVGSGSLLIAAAYFGGYVFGIDIDYQMIHGKTKPTRKQNRHIARKDENVLANMKQYGLEDQYIDILVGDSSLPLWRSDFKLDAIITDPPYGIREATERIGSNHIHKNNSQNENKETKFPSKVIYTFHQILYDLLYFSALHLKLGGRLVTWIPVFRSDYNEHNYLPEHACFSLISNCEQILSRVVSRRLLTFEKIKEPSNEELKLCKIYNNNFREKYFNYKYNANISSSGEYQNSDSFPIEKNNL